MTTPVDALRAFFSDMHAWGLTAIAEYVQIDWNTAQAEVLEAQRAAQLRSLIDIFERHCEAGARARRILDSGVSFDLDSPEYDPEDPVLEETRGTDGTVKIVVKGKWWEFRCHLVERDGHWWLKDRKESRLRSSEKWRPAIL